MSALPDAFEAAARLILARDPDLLEIVRLSLYVSLTATLCAALIALPLGGLLGATRFPGRKLLTTSLNALMGLPPVVVGLIVYLMLSRSGPMGGFQLLYTPAAMIIAQTILIAPIIAALTRQTVEDLRSEYDEYLRALGIGPAAAAMTLLYEARYSLLTAILAGFGRAIAEVGAVMIVGGNINHVTRTMTTAIALETSKGELALALGLGIVLIVLSLVVNMLVMAARGRVEDSAAARA